MTQTFLSYERARGIMNLVTTIRTPSLDEDHVIIKPSTKRVPSYAQDDVCVCLGSQKATRMPDITLYSHTFPACVNNICGVQSSRN